VAVAGAEVRAIAAAVLDRPAGVGSSPRERRWTSAPRAAGIAGSGAQAMPRAGRADLDAFHAARRSDAAGSLDGTGTALRHARPRSVEDASRPGTGVPTAAAIAERTAAARGSQP
jgi:hypothetical protein